MSEPREARADATSTAVDTERRRITRWLWRIPVLAAVAGGTWGVIRGGYVHFFKKRPDPTPTFQEGPAHEIATLDRFANVWDAVTFQYEGTPAVAVRIPEPVAGSVTVMDGVHVAAFSRICTHLGCVVTLNRDVAAIAFAFNYRADGPQLVCRCHLSVFDPERAGRAMAGPAVDPLPRLRLRIRGDTLIASGIEPNPLLA